MYTVNQILHFLRQWWENWL